MNVCLFKHILVYCLPTTQSTQLVLIVLIFYSVGLTSEYNLVLITYHYYYYFTSTEFFFFYNIIII